MRLEHAIDELTPARLRAVVAVADAGSFSRAAGMLGTSQSNVSRAVASVEAAIGATIFDRTTRSVRLTEAGREFVERAALVTDDLAATIRPKRDDTAPAPRLTIACLTSVSELHLAPAIAATSVRRLRCIEGLQTAVEQAVLSGRATAGVGDLADAPDQLTTRPLWREPIRVVAHTGHRLARRRRVSLDDLATEALVGFSRDAELRSTIDRQLAVARQLRTPDVVVDRYRTALAMVAAGLGVMLVPAIVTGHLPRGTRPIELDHPELHRTMGVLSRPDVEPPAALDDVLGHVVDTVVALPGVERVGQS